MCPRLPGERWQSYKPRLDAAHTAFLEAAYPQFGYVRESERHRTVTFDESLRPTTSGRILIQAPQGTDEERAAARLGRFAAEETLPKAPVSTASAAAPTSSTATTTSSSSTSTATAPSTSTSAAATTGDGYPSTGPAAVASASSSVQPASSKGKGGRNKSKRSSKKAGKGGVSAETGTGTVPTEPEPTDAPSTPAQPFPSSDEDGLLVDVSVSRDFERMRVDTSVPSGQDGNTPVAPPHDDRTAKERAASFGRAGLSLLDDDGDANVEGASFEIPPLLQAPSFRGTGGTSPFDPFFVAQMALFRQSSSRGDSEASAMETDKDLLGEFVKASDDADDDEDL